MSLPQNPKETSSKLSSRLAPLFVKLGFGNGSQLYSFTLNKDNRSNSSQ